jgi:hypothetical protein
MLIDITQLTTYYINLDEKVDRRIKMQDLLERNGFKDFKRFDAKKAGKRVGCSISHSSLLEEVVSNNEYPCLILEDDLEIYNFRNIIEVPDDADAVYLGFSRYGWNHNQSEPFPKSLKITELNDEYHRVYNMLSRHAIIHFNPDYDLACIEEMNKFIKYPDVYKAGDVSISRIHPEYKVYSLNEPIFYQDDNGTRGLTKKSLYECDYVEMDKL